MPRRRSSSTGVGVGLAFFTAFAVALSTNGASADERSNFKKSGSNRPYSHVITLYDADEQPIDPSVPFSKPYSPRATCKKCHDIDAISHGRHFVGSSTSPDGRPGEPFILSDARTGTRLPLSYRDWPGTYRPEVIGWTEAEFTKQFGRHLPGTGFTKADEGNDDPLDLDCMFCHAAERSFRHTKWIEQVAVGNNTAASTAALGLGKTTREGGDSEAGEPRVSYRSSRFELDGTVFLDIVRRPPNDACYACHTTQTVEGEELGTTRWQHDGDVHLRAGMLCVDCHSNGLDHHTVRGHEGEVHPNGVDVSTATCRGCHEDGGRFGAPKPQHRGLPPLHLERMSCTSCHSGPVPTDPPVTVQTSLAHALGVASQERTVNDAPVIVGSVLVPDENGVLTPHRMTWPAFWGWRAGDAITPMAPKTARRAVRRAFRVRQDFAREVSAVGKSADFPGKLAAALTALEKSAPDPESRAVFVSGGVVHALGENGAVSQTIDHPAAAPYRWPVGHDVRPARRSWGSGGCQDCHSEDAAMLHASITPAGPAPDASPTARPAHEWAELDPELLSAWQDSFELRDVFKWLIYAASIIIGVVLVAAVVSLLRRSRSTPEQGPKAADVRSDDLR